MPQFAIHAPVCSSTLRDRISKEKSTRQTYPVGPIGESTGCAYGYDGGKYYVEVGFFGHLAFGRMALTMEQAKAAYEAILFFDVNPIKWDYAAASTVLRKARKSNLSGDALMFFFGEEFLNFTK